MLKLYEEKKKHDEDIQKTLSGEKSVMWGMNIENDDATRLEQAKKAAMINEDDITRFGLNYGQQINYAALQSKPDLTEPQKVALK